MQTSRRSLARTEREGLCNVALERGPDAPTLCGGWAVRDLVVHLLVRERDLLGAPGILLPPLAGVTRARSRRLAEQDFAVLVERVRNGPPPWSPFALPSLDRAANTLEHLVHHEDVRRAEPGWEPRALSEPAREAVFGQLRLAARALMRPTGVPVEARWESSTGVRRTTLRSGEDPVVLSGDPVEVALFCYGRDQTRGVELTGPEDRVQRLRDAGPGS